MSIARYLVLAALVVAATEASGAPTKEKHANHNSVPKHTRATKPGSSTPFRVVSWASFNDQSQAKPLNEARLNIDVVSDEIEEITVFGKRLKRAEQESTDDKSATLLGPVIVTGTTHSDQANFTGMKVTAAIPVGGIPGLDAVMNVSGGYDQLNAGTTASSAAATVGLRLKF